MTGLPRAAAIVAGVAMFWMIGASRVPSHVRLPPSAVVPGATVTQAFGCTSLELEPFAWYCATHHFHSGVDLAAAAGSDVFSATSGVATLGYDPAGAGNYVLVRVDKDVRILYCHLSGVLVRSGEPVAPGQVIGTVGSTGLSTGPHLHFEVDVDGIPVDPAAWLAS